MPTRAKSRPLHPLCPLGPSCASSPKRRRQPSGSVYRSGSLQWSGTLQASMAVQRSASLRTRRTLCLHGCGLKACLILHGSSSVVAFIPSVPSRSAQHTPAAALHSTVNHEKSPDTLRHQGFSSAPLRVLRLKRCRLRVRRRLLHEALRVLPEFLPERMGRA